MISLIYGRSAPIPVDDDEDDALAVGYSSEDLTKSNEIGAMSDQTAGPSNEAIAGWWFSWNMTCDIFPY